MSFGRLLMSADDDAAAEHGVMVAEAEPEDAFRPEDAAASTIFGSISLSEEI